jgi:REP element-mobilizing transposase RayT
MPQSLANIVVHIVFSTKKRFPFLNDLEIREQMHRQIGGTSKTLKCPPIIVGGVEDHIHMLARQARTIALAEWIKEVKRITSTWVKTLGPRFREFQWQAGYGGFSVSQSQTDELIRYIQEQSQHHQKFDFQTEFRLLLERHGLAYDERYVWD